MGVDRGAYVAFLLLGASVLLPWNAYLGAIDYFASSYPEHLVAFNITWAYLYPLGITSFLILFRDRNQSNPVVTAKNAKENSLSIPIGLFLYGISMMSTMLVDVVGWTGSERGWMVIMAGIVVMAIAVSVAQGSLFRLAGVMPHKIYTQGVVVGTGVAGIIISGLRFGLLLTTDGPLDAESLRRSAMQYFSIAAGFCLSCIFVYFWLMNNLPLHGESQPLTGSASLDPNRERQGLVGHGDEDMNQAENGKWMAFRESLSPLVHVLLTLTVTLSVFPGLVTEIARQDQSKNEERAIVSLVFLFCLADFLGKSSSTALKGCFSVNSTLWGPTVLRTVALPWLYIDDFVSQKWNFTVNSIMVFILGLSNGAISGFAMTEGPSRASTTNKGFVGYLMYVGVVVGLVMGSLGSWIIEEAIVKRSR